MEKQQILDKTAETLKPFETENLIATLQNLTLKEVFTHPVMLIGILLVLFFGVYKRSKTVLLTVFFFIALIILMRYTLPPPGEEMSLKSLVPFIGGGVVIGAIIIYFSMIKSD